MSTAHRPAKQLVQKAAPRPGWYYLLPCLVLLAVFAYVKFRVNPALDYHRHGPFLILNSSSVEPFLARPAGLLGYAGMLLAQLNYRDWLGALVFTLSAALAWLLSVQVIRHIATRTSRVGAFIPVFLLLMLRNNYGSPVPAISLGLLLGLALASAFFRWSPSSRWLRAALCTFGSPLLLWLGGLGPAMLFASLAWLFEAFQRKQRALGASGVVGLSLAVLGLHLLGFPSVQLLAPATNHLLLTAAILFSVPVVALCLVLFAKITAPQTNPSASAPARHRQQSKTPWHQSMVLRRAATGLVLITACAAVWVTFNPQRKISAEIDYYADRGELSKILEITRQSTALDLASQIRMHRALYYRGRLGEDLFAFPNQLAVEPLPGVTGGIDSFRAQTRTLIELGLVSDAEHLAHEALEMEGERPDILLDLAEINVLKSRPAAARVFLNVLRNIPFQRKSADAFLANLDKNPGVAGHLELNSIRCLMVTNDLPHEGLPAEALLTHHLMFNSRNKMAFEYLMTHYLLTLDLRKLVDRLWQVDTFSYTHIPRHYEEALLLYQKLSGAKIELNRQVRPQTIQRFHEFSEAMSQKIYSSPEGQAQMSRAFGDTFWYYYYATQNYLKTLDRGKS